MVESKEIEILVVKGSHGSKPQWIQFYANLSLASSKWKVLSTSVVHCQHLLIYHNKLDQKLFILDHETCLKLLYTGENLHSKAIFLLDYNLTTSTSL